MKLLELPHSVILPNQCGKMFWGIPIVGIDQRAFKMLRKIQKERTQHISSAWNVGENVLLAKTDMDSILIKYFKWPCDLFHPADKCNALFFYPFGDLMDAEGYGEIEKRFIKFTDIGESFREKTYIELLELLIN